jgi:hypothetical protein
MNNKITDIIKASISTKELILKDPVLLGTIDTLANIITSALQKGNRVYFCGNGGSAADAQHLAAEFSGRFYTDRDALPAEALHCNTSYLTAVANDYSYDVVCSLPHPWRPFSPCRLDLAQGGQVLRAALPGHAPDVQAFGTARHPHDRARRRYTGGRLLCYAVTIGTDPNPLIPHHAAASIPANR